MADPSASAPPGEADGDPEAPARRVHPLGPFRSPGFRMLWAGGFFSSGGQWMQRAINLWLVYQLTGSPLQLGLIGAFQALPLLLFSIIGGTTADAVDRRKLLIVTQGIRLLLAVSLVALAASQNLEVWHIYAVAFCTTTAAVFDGPARQALIPRLVPLEQVTQAVVLNSMMFQFSRMLGPGLAGALLAAGGGTGAYLANLCFFVAAWLCFALLRAPATAGSARPPFLKMMVEGVQFVRNTPVILGLLVLDAFANFFGAFEALMPVFAEDVLHVGAAGYGVLASAPALGAFLGSIMVMFFGHYQRKGTVVLSFVFCFSLALIGFGLSPYFYLSLFFAAAIGMFDQVAVTFRNTILLLVTPDELRGRVESIRIMFVFGAPSLGSIQAGAVAGLIGAPLTIAMQALLVGAAVVGISVKVPAIRRVRM